MIGFKDKHHIGVSVIPSDDREDKVCFRCNAVDDVKYCCRYQYGEFYLCEKCRRQGGMEFIHKLHHEYTLLRDII